MRRAGLPLLFLTALLTGCPPIATVTPPGGSASPAASAMPSAQPSLHTNLPSPQASYAPIAALKVAGKDAPPWPAPEDVASHIHAAKLDAMPGESFVYHVHSHLDVFVDGKKVDVPGLVGIEPKGLFISPLHTHSNDGILHIEAPAQAVITLEQFLTEWGVSPAGFKGYVDGKETADVASIQLVDKRQIALVFGTAPATIPSAYPPGSP
ncbi:MAG: hypothetical protein JWM80_4862 [Cyanobacteria bacterium RYN_339]|nr:hypothetical protein [Cyanobacteria bacterium RYN_339]